jgi:hypothetical protein
MWDAVDLTITATDTHNQNKRIAALCGGCEAQVSTQPVAHAHATQ